MAKGTSIHSIPSLRGGMNNQDPAQSLQDDQTVLCENVEFFFSTLGERRLGCIPVDLAGSGLTAFTDIVHLSVHSPKLAKVNESELFGFACSNGGGYQFARRDKSLVWHTITATDAPTTTFPNIFRMESATLHGKWFVTYPSAQDRLHVYDGSTIRRTGIIAPTSAPTAVNTAVVGTFAGTRFYRVRFTEMTGSVILRRSEPSPEVTFTPSGVNSGAIVTRPATVGEGETNWELEASDGDGNFYIIATLPIGTTTFTDTINPSTDYAINGELSADIGDYQVIPSAKYIKVDQDRLVFAGSWTDAEKGSRVGWTPVWADPGVGNDERQPARLDDFEDLDWQKGGEVTGISDPVNGSFYAFKWSMIYKFQRTGRFDKAYDSFLISPFRGALYGSIIAGVDEMGKGCIYFLDPSLGPMRVGAQGLQHIQNIRGTWKRVNTNAGITCHGIYYPDKQQVKWWVALDGSDVPSYMICLQTNEVRSTNDGTERGWFTANGKMATAKCSTVFPEQITDPVTGGIYLSFKPYLGLPGPDFLLKSDVGSTDNGENYRGRIITKPYILAGLTNRFGIMNASLLVSPNHDPTTHINVKFIRDFGKEETLTTTTFVPFNHDQTYVIKDFDALAISDLRAFQVVFEDP